MNRRQFLRSAAGFTLAAPLMPLVAKAAAVVPVIAPTAIVPTAWPVIGVAMAACAAGQEALFAISYGGGTWKVEAGEPVEAGHLLMFNSDDGKVYRAARECPP